ncbi:prespore-specific transcriptional regulator RsfA [Thalassobacillus devorans]|uniref:Prespore-specific transcriptional regulator RsfA n=1 Tax=Thalassobacillus devorans TaxID=279813 RepID=A0ABQ1P8U0_9BACI|nr:RsfA family transcriptional regulator [Thalassobacillus devorans]NIK29758.1 prespore-specific regulator [Thalassobacillus devorans]GGC92592.1 prespore-specific transcriptional regulator RsfA [Thalassobacillus devorans]
MTKVRQDAWSHEDDLLLAETVLRHIREGSTQLKAFDEVGDALNRTSAACGFRWNAEVRQKYEQAIEIAKKQRKEKKRAEAIEQPKRPAKTQRTFAEVDANSSLVPEPANVSHASDASDAPAAQLNLRSVIDYLRNLQSDMEYSTNHRNKLEKVTAENRQLKEDKEKLEHQYAQLQRQLVTMQDDYQALIQIMDRARKMIVFDEDGDFAKPQFRMERNGNLEQVAK